MGHSERLEFACTDTETCLGRKTCVRRCKGSVRAVAPPAGLVHRSTMAVTEASHAASRALDDLYRRHGGDVYRYALAVLGNHADAEDVTQTTFLNAYRSLEQGVHPRKPANWLLTIASNAIKERFRREQARPREVELNREVATRGDEADGPSVGELLTALAKIPPQQRQAIVLREFEGRSYKEIADILGVTTGALETLLFRARRARAPAHVHRGAAGGLSGRGRTARAQGEASPAGTPPGMSRLRAVRKTAATSQQSAAWARVRPDPAHVHAFQGVRGLRGGGDPALSGGSRDRRGRGRDRRGRRYGGEWRRAARRRLRRQGCCDRRRCRRGWRRDRRRSEGGRDDRQEQEPAARRRDDE